MSAEESNPQAEEAYHVSPVRELRLDVCVPRKKRMMKSQPRQMQSSIDVLAEVLAERCAEGIYESEEVYEPEEDAARGEEEEDDDDDEAAAASAEDEGEDHLMSSREQRAANRTLDREERLAAKLNKKRIEPYKFTKCKLRNRHFLREGQGLIMIRSLGLEQFLLHTEVPRFNKNYCTDFITSYNHHKGSGVVNGRVIRITAQAVRKLTGLPLGHRGERAIVHDVRTEDLPIMDRLIPGLKRTSYGYDLRYLRYRDQTETFVAVASALSEKLVCRTFKLTYIKGAIILAMETSLRLKILMQWAEFMAETIKNAIKLTKLRTRNVRFAFGEWLTGMIENALGEELEGEKGTGLVENGPRDAQLELKAEEKEEPIETGDTALVLSEDTAQERVLSIGPAPTAHQEPLPLVVHNAPHPHRIKKRVRTGDYAAEEVRRLQQQLAEAEKRERWFVAMNLKMSQELDKVRQELDTVRGEGAGAAAAAALTMGSEMDPEENQREDEMQLVLKESPKRWDQTEAGNAKVRNGEDQYHMDRVIDHLEKKSARHEEEVLRLRQELQDQKNLIELLKKSRTVPLETYKESSEQYASLKREQKRLRREWEKEKLKPTL